MSNLGMGVMIGKLIGSRWEGDAYDTVMGNEITLLKIDKDTNRLVIGLGKRILTLWDDGQSCCEERYMSTDDELEYFVGATLTEISIQAGPEERDEYGGAHESEFLIVGTSLGVFTIVNHNVHNGYYGGFWLKCRVGEATSND